MKTLKYILLTILIAANSQVFADSDSRKEAELLLNTMGFDALLEKSINEMLSMQIQQNPAIRPFKSVMREFLNKHMSYESLKPEMLTLYADTYTADELKEINAFYKTPAGIKVIEKMPELMAKGSQIGAQRVQNNIQELEAMIKAESERIKTLE